MKRLSHSLTLAGLLSGAALSFWPAVARAGMEVELESGAVFVGLNDARIPGKGGTMISLVDDLSLSPAPYFRLRLGYRIGERHLVTALYAPLRLNARGTAEADVSFDGGTYPAGTPLLGVYRFDSYRLTYRYSLIKRDNLDVAVGFTGKIRDAEISLYGAEARRKTNTGFVPLLNLHVGWRPGGSPFGLLFDADALAAPQGRAEDVLIAGTYVIHPGAELYLGYRTVEGGADNDEVYNFAWVHYASLGMKLTF